MEKALKVLVVSIDFLPRIGGISLMAHSLANALVRNGADVAVLAPAPTDGDDAAAAPTPATDYIALYRLIPDPEAKPDVRMGFAAERERRRIERAVARIEGDRPFDRILLMHTYGYGPGVLDYCRKRGVALSAMVHGFEFRSLETAAQRRRARLFERAGFGPSLRSLVHDVLKSADEVLTNSRYTGGLIARAGIDRSTFATGCGIAESSHAPLLDLAAAPRDPDERHASRSRLGIPPDAIVVGTLCRLVPAKNVELLLRAVAALPDTHAIVIGNGPDADRLHAIAATLGIGARIHWMADADEAAKWRLLKTLDVFCLLSTPQDDGAVEGFGIALLEASAVSVPVIAARCGGMVEVVDDGLTGRLVEPNLAAVTDAIREITENPQLASKLVGNAQRQIRDRYNWAAIAQRLIERWRA